LALKRLKDKIENKNEFLNSELYREAKLYNLLSSCDYIVQFEESFFDENDYFYLVMEYCEVFSFYLLILFEIYITLKNFE